MPLFLLPSLLFSSEELMTWLKVNFPWFRGVGGRDQEAETVSSEGFHFWIPGRRTGVPVMAWELTGWTIHTFVKWDFPLPWWLLSQTEGSARMKDTLRLFCLFSYHLSICKIVLKADDSISVSTFSFVSTVDSHEKVMQQPNLKILKKEHLGLILWLQNTSTGILGI